MSNKLTRTGSLLCGLALLFLLVVHPRSAVAQLLTDRNGDGTVKVLAFGDSITAGVGDNDSPDDLSIGPGYPARLSQLIGVPVANRGVPGEELAEEGITRFPPTVVNSGADLVILIEGFNDSLHRLSPSRYRRLVQRTVNVTKVLGKDMMLVTLYTPCCDHIGEAPFADAYSDAIRAVGAANSVPVSDLERTWGSTCNGNPECELLHLPEGLHPNSTGYDVISQTLAATLTGVDLLAPGGAANLEAALGLAPGTVIVKPEAP